VRSSTRAAALAAGDSNSTLLSKLNTRGEGAAARSFFLCDACRSMKKLHERLQKHEMGVSGSEDDEQQEALLKSSGLMPKSTEKEEDDEDSQVINLNLTTPGQQGVMVVVPAVAANAAMSPNSAVSAAVQAAANAAAAGDAASSRRCMPPSICNSPAPHARRSALAPNVAAALNAAKNRAAAIAGGGTAAAAKPGAAEAEKRAHFYDEIEINDLPQKVRYRATHREFTADIEEEFSVAITVKGVFITGKAGAAPHSPAPALSDVRGHGVSWQAAGAARQSVSCMILFVSFVEL
jgi:hypothetical protein